jgi:hypothetical protein
MMRKLIPYTLLVGLVGMASGMEVTGAGRSTTPTQRGSQVATVTSLNAPNEGVITRVDAAAAKIGVAGRDMLIKQGYVALLDKRTNADGLLDVADLSVGMRVRYQLRDEPGSTTPRVVVLWVMRDPTATGVDKKPSSTK